MGNRDIVSRQLIEQDRDRGRKQGSPDTGADAVPVIPGPGERRGARHETRSADAVRCPAFTHFQMAPETPACRLARRARLRSAEGPGKSVTCLTPVTPD